MKTIFSVLALSLVALGCSNSASNEEEEHEDAEGFRLKMNGQTIVEQLPDQDLTGSFQLTEGQETDLISIYFISHDGDEFQPGEDEFSLGYEFSETGIANFEQHAEDGKWSFHLHGESPDTTQFRVMLMHSGHPDFTSQNIQIEVQTAQ